ncbi:Response regulator receiver domain-containing protein [Marinobacterium stanieri]|uniref:Response regulator receiver domain-containing protein n=1 Tax=Marinobacterium stanieri TaxID=49186 RepID=A0A1N6XUB7_9GAMM|nr:Response regulator receiver domain-containing protein [Marinobacterium stanieri]
MKIGILAFPADQQTKLQRILSLSKTRAYELVETPEKGSVDLLVVFGEEGLSLSNDFDLPSSHILVASRVAPPNGHPHLKLPFISSRVLRIIDGTTPLAKPAATPEPKPAVSPQPTTPEARPAATPQPAPVAKPQQPEAPAPTVAPTQPVQPAARPVTPAPATPAQPSATAPAAAPQAQPTAPAPKAPSSTPAAAPQAEPVTKQPPAADVQPSPAPAAPVTPAAKPAPQADAGGDDKDNLFKKYDSQIEEAQRQKAQQDAAASSMEYSVLVVDDSHAMQQVLAKELAKLEQTINVDFADDGESALAKVAEATYDFIFLDIMMPGIDGFETCTQMRALPNLKKTPIIMLSSKTSPLDEVKGIMAGSSTYLTKPIDSDEFLKVIKRVSRWITEFKK